ncbi:MAG: class I SAM-dependent methyltransferase [Solirubrobacterales bacterium]
MSQTESVTPPDAPATAPDIPTGNTTDKYNLDNPVARRLMANFTRQLWELFGQAAPKNVLDVGCGEGVLTEQFADRLDGGRIVGIDLDDPKLRAEWGRRQRPNLMYQAVPAEKIPFGDGEFELVSALEVLEHVDDPAVVLGEMRRVSSGHLLVSVPREPIWRAVNMARGAYLSEWGNTPGHLNHWSKRSFVELLGNFGTVTEVRSPFPWTMLLGRV